MYLLTVQYITPHNTLTELQFLTNHNSARRYEDDFAFDTVDGVRVTLDRKRIYLDTFAPYTPPAAPEKGADEAKLS